MNPDGTYPCCGMPKPSFERTPTDAEHYAANAQESLDLVAADRGDMADTERIVWLLGGVVNALLAINANLKDRT